MNSKGEVCESSLADDDDTAWREAYWRKRFCSFPAHNRANDRCPNTKGIDRVDWTIGGWADKDRVAVPVPRGWRITRNP
jgi:hypothetical protein